MEKTRTTVSDDMFINANIEKTSETKQTRGTEQSLAIKPKESIILKCQFFAKVKTSI